MSKRAAAVRLAGVSKKYSAGLRGTRSARTLTALDGVDLTLEAGEILSLVGESGSGKSTLAKIVVGSLSATGGVVEHNGQVLPKHLSPARRRRVQMVFQDPYLSLNPRLSVGAMLSELLRVHKIVPRREVRGECIRLLHLVGLEEDALSGYAGQFSGGQRQRVAIARALVVRPDILIADEPVSALDVSVQATILDLLLSLRSQLNLSVLFVAHNLAVVQQISDRVCVMYLGRIVEIADRDEIFSDPRHPYTRMLIDAVPRMRAGAANTRVVVEGEPPSPFDIPAGCRFRSRCRFAVEACGRIDPKLVVSSPRHEVACIRANELPRHEGIVIES